MNLWSAIRARLAPKTSPSPTDPSQVTSTATIKSFFEDAARDEENYPSSIDPRIEFVQAALRHFGPMESGRIADIGSGKGRFARIFQEHYPKATVVAVDLAEAMLAHASGLERAAASMTHLPFKDGSFEGACAIESLEHAVDIEGAVAEMARIVRPGGRIYIVDKNIAQWGRLETPSWERWFDGTELKQILGRYCRKVTSRPISYWEDVEPDGLFIAWLAEK